MPLFSKPVLALDTAAGASVCLLYPDGSSVTDSMTSPRAHSRELLPLLQKLLERQNLSWQELGAFAVGIGPGSFTGLRVACATIAGINASLQRPVYGLCSLGITARQAATDETVWAIEDARSKLVYAAKYKQGIALEAASCIPWDEFAAKEASAYVALSDIPVALDGWHSLPIKISREQALVEAVRNIRSDSESALWLEPVYLQASQAEKSLI